MIEFTWAGKNRTAPQQTTILSRSLVFPGSFNTGSPVTNQLVFGDNFSILSNLTQTHAGRVDLIYIDPPFFTNRDFSARVGKGEDSRKPKNWRLAAGYQDTWNGLEPYLQFLYERLNLAHQILSPSGSLDLHLDWHADAYARLILDEIFGSDHFLNEIIWTYHGPSPIRSAFNRKHDTILVYTKSDDYIFNVDDVRTDYNQNTIKTFASSPKAGFGKIPDLKRGKVPEDWWYFPVVARLHAERTGYPTQKPEKLLERIIKASSNPGSYVLDFFSGSGTTARVANRLGRQFIAADNQLRAIHITAERLMRDGSSPFAMLELENSQAVIQARDNLVRRVEGGLELIWDEDIFFWEWGIMTEQGIFNSLGQSTRAYRETKLQKNMAIPSHLDHLVVRVTDRSDQIFQQVI